MERKRNIQPQAERRRAEAGAWRAAPAPMPTELERRVSNRHEFQGAHASEPVRLVDLSVHGCCIGLATAAATSMLITVIAIVAPLLYWQSRAAARAGR